MIKLKNILMEAPARFKSVHLKSTFDSLFGRFYSHRIPLTTKFMQKILGKERVSVFHISGREGAKNIGRIVGKKSALSTFSKVDKGEKLAKGKGIQTQGGIVFQLEGSLLVASIRDMQTHPDKTGRRWVSPLYLAGKVAGEKMSNELEKFVKNNKRDRDTFDEIQYQFEREIQKDMPDISYEEKKAIVMKEMNKIKRDWIVKYIKFCMKMMNKYKKQIKRHILSQKDKPSKYGWNELIVNQIKVKDVFILKRENYRETREAIEKVATGTITVGSPAQYRKWFKQRGGIINDSSWRD
jgi:hypothetical protein